MKKKVFSVLLTVALATGVLAGCGSSAATGNNAATGAAQNEGSQTASATTAGEESGDTIVIRSCFATGMTGAVNRFAIEKGLHAAGDTVKYGCNRRHPNDPSLRAGDPVVGCNILLHPDLPGQQSLCCNIRIHMLCIFTQVQVAKYSQIYQ